MRIAVEGTTTPLIDMAAVFESYCPAEPCPRFLYRDHHPTAEGYRLMAEQLVERRVLTLPP